MSAEEQQVESQMQTIGGLPGGKTLFYADESFSAPGFYVWAPEVEDHVKVKLVEADTGWEIDL